MFEKRGKETNMQFAIKLVAYWLTDAHDRFSEEGVPCSESMNFVNDTQKHGPVSRAKHPVYLRYTLTRSPAPIIKNNMMRPSPCKWLFHWTAALQTLVRNTWAFEDIQHSTMHDILPRKKNLGIYLTINAVQQTAQIIGITGLCL